MSTQNIPGLVHGGQRPPLAATSLELLDRSRASLLAACRTGDAGERYVEAHLGALRAAAALLAARSSSSGRSRPRSVWEVLPTIAPELSEWATFFAGTARQRAAVERGGPLSARESDDLLRQSEIFLEIVQDLLGVPRAEPLPDYIAPVSVRGSRSGLTSGPSPTLQAPDAAGPRRLPAHA
jgi:hypothetical protein